jgi:hypothetical protein
MGSGGPYVCLRLYRKPLSEFAKMLTTKEFSHPNLTAAVFCTLFALAGLAPAPAQAQMQTTQTIALSPGASTTIVLRENPSTGFRSRLSSRPERFDRRARYTPLGDRGPDSRNRQCRIYLCTAMGAQATGRDPRGPSQHRPQSINCGFCFSDRQASIDTSSAAEEARRVVGV